MRQPQNPWNAVALAMLRVNEIEKAIELGRLYEKKLDPGMGVFYMRGDERIGPLAHVAKKLAEERQPDKAYEISKDIKLRLDKYYALTAIILAEIKAGNFSEASRIQTELLAIPKSDEKNVFPGSEEAQLPHYLMGIAVALAGAGKLDDALAIAKSLKKPDDKYTAFERIAKELIKLGKIPEAINVIDRSDDVLRSRSLANLVEWLLDTDKVDAIPRILPLIEYGDDKSRASAAVAKMYARSGSLRLARYTADSCTSQADQLSAYTVILVEYGKRQNPKVVERLKTASATEVKTASPT
jgi:poly(beta-D-mannuronate) C5 epimerase